MSKYNSALIAQASMHTVSLKQFQNYDVFNELCEYAVEHLITRQMPNGSIEIKNLVGKGIQITLYPTPYSGILYVQVNLQKLISKAYRADEIIDPTDDNLERAKELIEKNLKALGLPYKVRDYDDEQIHLCVNVERSCNNGYAREFLRVRRKGLEPRSGKLSPFMDLRRSDIENKQIGKDYLRYEFTWGALVLYDKKKQSMREGLPHADKVPKGAIRYELQLKKQGIQEYKKVTGLHGWVLACWLSQHSGDILYEKLSNLYFGGIYLKEKALLDVIDRSHFNKPVRKQMQKYVELARKKGEAAAAKATMKRLGWSKSEFIRFRRRFEEINVQPVPLRKNYEESWLDTPEAHLPRLLNLKSSYDDDGFYQLRRRDLPL